MQLTPQQLTQFRDDGYTVVRGLISPAEAQRVRNRLLEIFDNNPDWPLEHFQILDPVKYRNAKGGFIPWGVQSPAKREPVFQEIADHPNLQTAMAQLLGGPVKRFTDQALIKSLGIDGQSFYHQDSYYWHLKPESGCNTWIALDDVDANAIALAILPGSHKTWTLTPHEQYFDEPAYHDARSGKAFQRFRIPRENVDFSREILLPMSPGDAAFFTNFTWHRADPNKTGLTKCAYAIAYMRSDV